MRVKGIGPAVLYALGLLAFQQRAHAGELSEDRDDLHGIGDNAVPVATKTAYESSLLFKDEDFIADLESEQTDCGELCTIKHLNLLARHGSRMPNADELARISELTARMKANSTWDSPQWLRIYHLGADEWEEGLLADRGVQELMLLGFRWRERLGWRLLLDSHGYDPVSYSVRHTFTSRTGRSASALARGFFGTQTDVAFEAASPQEDTLLLFYNLCDNYVSKVLKNSDTYAQRDAFLKSDEVVNATRLVAKNLGLPAEFNFSPADALTALDACAFDVILHNRNDRWCEVFLGKTSLSAFTPLETFNYVKDLEKYYESFYGDYQSKVAREWLEQMLTDIYTALSPPAGVPPKKGRFNIGHGDTIMGVLSMLGLFEDSVRLTADLSHEEREARMFETSKVTPFGANIATMVTQCGKASKVRVFVNEQPVTLSWCEMHACPTDIFLTGLQQILDNLPSFSDLCGASCKCSW